MPNPVSHDAPPMSVPMSWRLKREWSPFSLLKRSLRVLGFVAMTAVLALLNVSGVVAANPYEATYVDDVGVWQSNCVWWAWQRWSEVHGEELPQWGNAGLWTDGAIGAGYRVDGVPAAGSIVVTWESPLGHVAFVEQVDPADPSTFLVSEYGFAAGTMEHQRWMTTDGSLLFIHPKSTALPEATAAARALPEQEVRTEGSAAAIYNASQPGASTAKRDISVAP